jgi:hypothetical protein
MSETYIAKSGNTYLITDGGGSQYLVSEVFRDGTREFVDVFNPTNMDTLKRYLDRRL